MLKLAKKFLNTKKAIFFKEFKQNHFSRTRELPGVALVIFEMSKLLWESAVHSFTIE